jgi:putative copper export protein
MTAREVILWLHVLCGVIWVGACATFIVAAAAVLAESNESHAFAVRVAPQINRLCVPLAIAIPATGIGNLFFVAQARGADLPAEFIAIIAAKVGLLVIMAMALFGAWRAAPSLERQPRQGSIEPRREVNIRRIIAFYGLIVGAGIAALGLGLWLAGT